MAKPKEPRNLDAKPRTPLALDNLNRRIIAALREPLIVLDGDFRIIFVNASFYRTFKVIPSETEGRFIYELGNHQWDIPSLRGLLEDNKANHRSFQDFEVEHDFPEIGRRTMLLNAQPLSQGEGETSDLILLAIKDITERKQAEEALRESEERFRIAAETSNDVIYEWDLKQNLTWSDRIDEMLGYDPAEFSRTLDGWMESVHPEDIDHVKASIKAHLERRVPYIEEYRIRRKDGVYRWWTARGDTSMSLDGKPVRWIGTVTDITERKRAEESLRKRTAELEFLNRELEAFSYSVSHDLKAPLRAIQGFSRMLMAEHADKLDAEAVRLLQVITTNTKLMNNLIDDLLALSRLGRLHVRKSVVNLTAISEKVFGKLRSQAPKRDLQLTLGDLPMGSGDQSLLYQVMENLLANAIKFTVFRKTAFIEVGGRTEGKENIYYVKDNGVGFDERYIDKLFRPFQRLHSDKKYEGTGIGLAIVQRIIQRHGGRVWAEGKVGEGATLYFALPKKED